MSWPAAALGPVAPSKDASPRPPSWAPGAGAPLYRLLRRPAAYAWLPLALMVAFTVIVLGFFLASVIGQTRRTPPLAGTLWVYAAFLGLLVGQAIKEVMHCRFSWGLPRLRPRLLAGTLLLGTFVALFTREIVFTMITIGAVLLGLIGGNLPGVVDLADIWTVFPGKSLGLFALSFLTFWIGVRPSPANLLGVMVPIVLMSHWLGDWVADHGIVTAAMASPLIAYLVYATFGIETARRRPFIETQPLAGGAWARSESRGRGPRSVRRRALSRRHWRPKELGKTLQGWVKAGWYENHGWAGRTEAVLVLVIPATTALLLAWTVARTFVAAPGFWLGAGFESGSAVVPSRVLASMGSLTFGSMILGLPVAACCAVYGSISLRKCHLYPLSRHQLAEVEYWSSLAEALVAVGLVTAMLHGFWMVTALGGGNRRFGLWSRVLGGESGWMLVLFYPVFLMIVALPVFQYFRLRHVRAPAARSPVVQLLTFFALTAVLTAISTMAASVILRSLVRSPFLLHIVVLVTAAMISQYLYRRALDRYFARVDLA